MKNSRIGWIQNLISARIPKNPLKMNIVSISLIFKGSAPFCFMTDIISTVHWLKVFASRHGSSRKKGVFFSTQNIHLYCTSNSFPKTFRFSIAGYNCLSFPIANKSKKSHTHQLESQYQCFSKALN